MTTARRPAASTAVGVRQEAGGPAGERSATRASLRQALDIAADCHAELLVDRVRGTLAAGGGRSPRQKLSGEQALTPAEWDVAALAGSGLTNRQIAERLVVTQKTVEGHLRRTFRKLDITSRTRLSSRLAQRRPDDTP